jgi:hypothetical protein
MEIDNQGGSAATRGELWERARDYAKRAEFDQRTDFEEGMRRTGKTTYSSVQPLRSSS